MERAIRGNYSLVKAWKADTAGNLVFRYTARNFNPMIATASPITIAEVEEIVEAGQIHPDQIHVPGIYVQRLFKGVPSKKIEKLTIDMGASKAAKAAAPVKDDKAKDQEKRERIAKYVLNHTGLVALLLIYYEILGVRPWSSPMECIATWVLVSQLWPVTTSLKESILHYKVKTACLEWEHSPKKEPKMLIWSMLARRLSLPFLVPPPFRALNPLPWSEGTKKIGTI